MEGPALFLPYSLNLSAMRKAADKLKGTHDFKAFQSASDVQGLKTRFGPLKTLLLSKKKILFILRSLRTVF